MQLTLPRLHRSSKLCDINLLALKWTLRFMLGWDRVYEYEDWDDALKKGGC